MISFEKYRCARYIRFKEYVPYFEFNLPLFMKKEYTNLILTFKVFDLNDCSGSYLLEYRLLINKTVESVDIRRGYYDFSISKELVTGEKLLVEAQLLKIKEDGSINPLGNILKNHLLLAIGSMKQKNNKKQLVKIGKSVLKIK